MGSIWLNLRVGFYSVLLHAAVLGLLTVSIEFAPQPVIRPRPDINIVEAVAVDNKEIEAELQRLKEIEQAKERKQNQKQQELEKQLEALQKKASQVEKKRRDEEKRLSEAKKRKEEQEKKRREEEKKLAEAEKRRQELERQRKQEEEKRRRAEAERLGKQKEEALQKQLAEEQRQADQQVLQNFIGNIERRIASNFNISGLPKGLECVLLVRLIPSGEVINVTVSKSSGNEIFDRRALVAVEKASPLPVPEDTATFDRIGLRQFNFRFKPEE